MTDTVQDPEEYVTVGKFMEPVDAQMAKGCWNRRGLSVFCRARMRII